MLFLYIGLVEQLHVHVVALTSQELMQPLGTGLTRKILVVNQNAVHLSAQERVSFTILVVEELLAVVFQPGIFVVVGGGAGSLVDVNGSVDHRVHGRKPAGGDDQQVFQVGLFPPDVVRQGKLLAPFHSLEPVEAMEDDIDGYRGGHYSEYLLALPAVRTFAHPFYGMVQSHP